MASDWGVPDWRDAGAYPDGNQITVRQWWWEFTRRRPDYRERWTAAAPVAGYAHRYATDVDEFRLRFELSMIQDPTLSLTDSQLVQFRVSRNFARSPLEPMLDQPNVLEGPQAKQALALVAHTQRLADDEDHVLFNFDLSRPLAPQLDVAERHLTDIQEELFGKVPTRRPRRDRWREFLRAIDARDAGANYREMRDEFWPDRSPRKDGKEAKTEQSARDIYLAACRLRDNFPI